MSPMRTPHNSTRRGFLAAVSAGIGASYLIAADVKTNTPKSVRIVDFDAAGKRKDVMEVPKIVKTDAEWRKQLDAEQYRRHPQARHRTRLQRQVLESARRRHLFAASAAARRCSIRRRNSNQARAGRVSISHWPKRTSPNTWTGVSESRAPKWNALAATLIWGMFSMMAPNRPACAIA